MPFNSSKNGFQNEMQFVKKLNNKKLKEIEYDLRLFIEDLYPKVDENDTIKCFKNKELQKGDIFISINDVVMSVSIKKGVKNSVHTEPISEFIHFLIENKMPRDMVINFLKYHYADGTTNGKGKNRMTVEEYKVKNQDSIDEINKFINHKEILVKAIDRFVLLGRNSDKKIDAVLYGVPGDFIWIKSQDVYKILLKQKDKYSTSIHFSSLVYQPLNRCINGNPKYEKYRFISQLKWYNISDDVIENMNDNCMNKI